MIRVDLPDIPTTDRLIEALHVAAGTHPHTPQATEWRRLAHDLETALDALGPAPPAQVHQTAA
ncbi:hypothetical protein GPA10_05040 [Streptomyces sp. p1417]|uniref:Uncharacterized protein n=1 Tax=Streptomyces typhae TaxID=2681492 RepID=A0A6L6WVY2_9ACTN|nr:hypothetical protein [Streptomyces typhae]MVO84151.1 hypothetical protein [Streptomyces typhae]